METHKLGCYARTVQLLRAFGSTRNDPMRLSDPFNLCAFYLAHRLRHWQPPTLIWSQIPIPQIQNKDFLIRLDLDFFFLILCLTSVFYN